MEEIVVSTNVLFNMNVEIAARQYKEKRDDASFLVLYDFLKKSSGIIAYKYGITKDADIVQDCAVKLIEKIHQFDPEKSYFYNWCYTIVQNEYKQKFRRNAKLNRSVEVEDVDYKEDVISFKKVPSYEPEYFPEDKLTEDDVEEALEKFSTDTIYKRKNNKFYVDTDTMKQVFILFLTNDYTHREISDITGVSISRIKLIIYRYRRFFIDFLKKEYPNKKFPEQIYGNDRKYKRDER